MIVLHVLPMDLTRANGPRFSVPGLAGALNRLEGIQSGIYNTGPEDKLVAAEVESYDFPFYTGYGSIRVLPAPFNHPDLVVFHGVYKKSFLPIWREISVRRIPYVLTPRVSLTREAQNQRGWKKRLANILLMNSFIRHAAAIHYLTEREKDESAQFGGNCFVVGNGVQLPTARELVGRSGSRMIFIGRYDIRHKGLDVLMLAIGLIKDEMLERGLFIDLYGSNDSERILLEQQAEVNALDGVLALHGPVYGKMKEEVLSHAELFVATSRFEGHPMAVLEAMSRGLAVIATPGTNMAEEIEETEAGWVTELDFREVGKAILQAFEDKEELVRRGNNARKLIEERYTWETVARKTLKQYERILDLK